LIGVSPHTIPNACRISSSAFAKATAGQVRNPFAVEKMKLGAPNRANPESSVLYRSRLNPKIRRNFEVFTPCDFIVRTGPVQTMAPSR
jgi:hypothetical protein